MMERAGQCKTVGRPRGKYLQGPEPGTLSLLPLGLGWTGVALRRRQHQLDAPVG